MWPTWHSARSPSSVRLRAIFGRVIRSEAIEALFPGTDVVAFESDVLMPNAELFPEELDFIGNAVAGRRAEFATGRACARAAIDALGIAPQSIPVGEGRQPQWPEGITAAITHTRREGREFVAAVAARTDGSFGIGLDAEVVQTLKDGVRNMIVTEPEQANIETLPTAKHDEAVIRIFSAKEAFYKAQYALSSSWVGFGDMALEGSRLVANSELPVLASLSVPVDFHQVLRNGLVISGVVVTGA